MIQQKLKEPVLRPVPVFSIKKNFSNTAEWVLYLKFAGQDIAGLFSCIKRIFNLL